MNTTMKINTAMDYEYNGKILLKEGNDSLAAENFEKIISD